MLVTTNDLGGGIGFGAISEDSTMLNQSLMRKKTICNENICVRIITKLKSEDWTIFGVKILKKGFGFSEVLS